MKDHEQLLLCLVILNFVLNFVCMYGFVYEIKKARDKVIDEIRRK